MDNCNLPKNSTNDGSYVAKPPEKQKDLGVLSGGNLFNCGRYNSALLLFYQWRFKSFTEVDLVGKIASFFIKSIFYWKKLIKLEMSWGVKI